MQYMDCYIPRGKNKHETHQKLFIKKTNFFEFTQINSKIENIEGYETWTCKIA